MTIAEDALIEFFGTQDEVTTSPATVADAAYSIASDTSEWTNDDDAPFAMFRLLLTAAGLGGAPTGDVNLYAQCIDIDGSTGDQAFPSDNFPHTYLGTFPILRTDTDQQSVIGPIKLPNYKTSSTFVFVIQNQMGVATGATWTLHVTPVTYGPHPA